MTMVHATVSPGAQFALPWRRDFNALAYVLSGRGTAGHRASGWLSRRPRGHLSRRPRAAGPSARAPSCSRV